MRTFSASALMHSVSRAGHVPPIHGALYTADGRLLMTCGGDGSIKVWSVADMEVLLTLCGHTSQVRKMTKPSASHMLASASEGGELAFWDLRFAQQLAGAYSPALAPA